MGKNIKKTIGWMNRCSNVKHSSLKFKPSLGIISFSILITLFCFAFTYSYYAWFGVDYFLHFDNSDMYNFTLGRISVFFSIAMLIAFLSIAFIGFFVTKNECNEYFSNYQLWILRIVMLLPIFITIIFVFKYSDSIKKALIVISFFILIFFAFYKQNKFKHDIFLFALMIIIPLIGMITGKKFAEDRFNSNLRIELIRLSDNHKILDKFQKIIGQNKTSYIILNEKDTICNFIPKSSDIVISFKGKISEK